jgi:hypothetical protein
LESRSASSWLNPWNFQNQYERSLKRPNRRWNLFVRLNWPIFGWLADAMGNLGRRYRDGHGVTQNYQQARWWYEKAAAAGNVMAMDNLGWLYRGGHGVTQGLPSGPSVV